MAGERLRLAALTVLGGSLHGRRYQPEEVVGEVLIGSDPDCHLVVDLPAISPIHARVWCDLDASKVHDTRAPRGLYLNARRVEGEAPLGRNDVLWLGPPGDPQSACVQVRFEPWVEKLPLAQRELPRVAPELPLAEALPMLSAPGTCVLVMDGDDRLVGILTSENLSEFILLRQASTIQAKQQAN